MKACNGFNYNCVSNSLFDIRTIGAYRDAISYSHDDYNIPIKHIKMTRTLRDIDSLYTKNAQWFL